MRLEDEGAIGVTGDEIVEGVRGVSTALRTATCQNLDHRRDGAGLADEGFVAFSGSEGEEGGDRGFLEREEGEGGRGD